MGAIVPPYGPSPNDVLLVGEAPGYNEALLRRPFCGASGEELNDLYLTPLGWHTSAMRLANVVQEYFHGNPNPSAKLIAKYTPPLEAEIASCRPKVIIAVGKFAAAWFLGSNPKILEIHGIPCRAGTFDSSLEYRGNGAVIVPAIHPAAAMRPGGERLRASIAWDFQQAVGVIEKLREDYGDLWEEFESGELAPVDFCDDIVVDEYAGKEIYQEVGSSLLKSYLAAGFAAEGRGSLEMNRGYFGVDTEGDQHNPWSIQVSNSPGTGVTLRVNHPSFANGIREIQRHIDAGVTLIFHNLMHDANVCRAIGLDLTNANIADTMYMLYEFTTEPQGLKAAVWRHCNMAMKSYAAVVGPAAIDRQLEYLRQVVTLELPKISKVQVIDNDGTFSDYGPQSPSAKAKKILRDWDDGKLFLDIDGNEEDTDEVTTLKTPVYERWYNSGVPIVGDITHKYVSKKLVLRMVQGQVEKELDPMPIGGLEDVDDDKARIYECRDPDATRRLYFSLLPKLERLGLA